MAIAPVNTLVSVFAPDSVAIAPDNSETVFTRDLFQAYKSTDGGTSWRTIPHPDRFHRLLAISLTTPPTYYSLQYNENRLYRSTNDGANWRRIGAGLPRTSIELALTPGRQHSLYAVAHANNDKASARGLYHSTDSGANWSRISTDPFKDGYISEVVVASANPSILYSNGLLFRSTDGGVSWSDLANSTGPIVLEAIDPEDASILYARTSDGTGRVLKSRDGGATWSPAGSGLDGLGFVALAVNPRQPATLYAGTHNGIFKSDDGATSWQEIRAAGLSASISELLAGPEGVLLAGDRFRSTDSGASWHTANLPGPAYLIAADPGNANHLYGFTDTNDLVYKRTDGGASWSATPRDLSTGFLSSLAIVPGDPPRLVAWAGGKGFVKSTDGGVTWTRLGSIVPSPYRLVADPSNPNLLYAAVDIGYDCFDGLCDSFIKSTDGGISWKEAGPGVGNNYYYVSALVLDPDNPATIYVGITDGRLFKSRDGGSNWFALNPFPTDLSHYAPLHVILKPTDSQTIYVGYRHHVYTSTDGGDNWRKLTPELSADVLIQSLAIDPSGTSVHVGTPRGVFDYHFASPCAAALSPTSQSFAAEGGAGSVTVTAPDDCRWIAESDADWLRVSSPSSGSGSATLSYTVALNESTAQRTGRLGIGGRVLKVTQAGVPVRIFRASAVGKKLFVEGENFDPGSILLLNGEAQITKNDSQNPRARLIGKRAGKKIKPGDRLQVRNPNGSLSDEFIYSADP